MNLKEVIFFDIETYPNYILFAFKVGWNGQIITYELKGEEDTLTDDARQGILTILTKYTTCGFNSNNFDMPLTFYALTRKTAKQIFDAVGYIIQPGRRVYGWQFYNHFGMKEPKGLQHIDLMEVAPGGGSLKMYGARCHSKTLWDLPTEPGTLLSEYEIIEMRDYCVNDLNTTHDLFNGVIKELALRRDMSDQYGINLISKSDAQIAEAVIVSELKFPQKPKPRNVNSNERFRYNVPAFLRSFQTEMCQSVLSFIEMHEFQLGGGGSIEDPIELKNGKIELGRSVYQMGVGGLHSTEKKQAIVPGPDQRLIDKDVTSYYPYIILNQGLRPEQLGDRFLEVYKDIVNKRLAAKKSGDKVTAESLKITINGSFGKFGNRYSSLYDPQLLMQVTLTGQLSLLLLIERIEVSGVGSVVSANTDGFVTLINDAEWGGYEDYEAICAQWERDTGFALEDTEYRALYSRDVNNYCGVTLDGKDKSKGAFGTEDGLRNNPTFPIIAEAAKAFLIHGTPIHDTIFGCMDVRKFLSSRTVKGGAIFDAHRAEKPLYDVGETTYKTPASADRNAVKLGSGSVMRFDGGAARWNRFLKGTKPNRKGKQVPDWATVYGGGGTYLGKVVRWYYSTDGGTIHYKLSANKVPLTDRSRIVMTLPDQTESEVLLAEDECAPDAYVYFEKKFKEITGMSDRDFKKRATITSKDDDDHIRWEWGAYTLMGFPPGLHELRSRPSTVPGDIDYGRYIAAAISMVVDAGYFVELFGE